MTLAGWTENDLRTLRTLLAKLGLMSLRPDVVPDGADPKEWREITLAAAQFATRMETGK